MRIERLIYEQTAQEMSTWKSIRKIRTKTRTVMNGMRRRKAMKGTTA